MTDLVKPQPPMEYEELKQVLRLGLKTIKSRASWWPVLPDLLEDARVTELPDMVSIAEKLSVLMNEPLLDRNTQSTFTDENNPEFVIGITKYIMYVLRNNKKLETADIPYFEKFVRITAFVIKRIDVSYLLLSGLLSKKDKYFNPGRVGHHVMLYTFRALLQQYMPKTYLSLTQIGALDDKYLNLLFVDLFVELLPERVVLSMMDSFLLEGVKILYRYGMALLFGYKAQLKARKYPTAHVFWLSVKADAVAVSNDENAQMLFKTIGSEENLPPIDPFLLFENAKNKAYLQSSAIYENSFDTDRSVLDKLFRPMAISRANLKKLREEAEKTAPAAPPGGSDVTPVLTRKSSVTDSVRQSVSGTVNNSADMKTGNLGRKNSMTRQSISSPSAAGSSNANGGLSPKAGPSAAMELFPAASPENSPSAPSKRKGAAAADNTDIDNVATAVALQSSVVEEAQAQYMLHCIPLTTVMEGLELRYSTALHGFDLSMLYSLCPDLSPCVLLVKLQAPYEHVVVGAYIDRPISPPSLEVRGAGESCIFRLDADQQKCFRWVGNTATLGRAENTNHTPGSGEHEASDAALPSATLSQFAVASPKYLAIGGSLRHGSNALRLDESLRYLDTGSSDTFGNPALVVAHHLHSSEGEKSASDGQSFMFDVAHVELWCGSNSIRKANRHGVFDQKTSVLG